MKTEFHSLAEFLAMGGHGFYVWLAYGTALLVFLVLLCEPALRRRRLRARLQAFYRREQLDAQAETTVTETAVTETAVIERGGV